MREKFTALIEGWLAPLQDELGVAITGEMIELPHPPDPSLGDYALNLPLQLAKQARKAPMLIAARIAALLSTQLEWVGSVRTAPPGYVNVTIADDALVRLLDASEHDVDLGLRKLGKPETIKLLEFPEVVAEVEKELRPHTLCTYLYEMATAFSTFYDNCPVLTAETGEIRTSRLFLCRATQETLARGLYLLGIQAPREMQPQQRQPVN